jgi:hypothetical protein
VLVVVRELAALIGVVLVEALAAQLTDQAIDAVTVGGEPTARRILIESGHGRTVPTASVAVTRSVPTDRSGRSLEVDAAAQLFDEIGE